MELPFPIAPLDVGLIVGHTTSTTTRIFVRIPSERPHALTIAGRALPIVGNRAADHTAVVDVDGLEANHEYPLDVLDDRGVSVLPPDLGARVRTMPLVDERLCFAFVSCHLPFEASGLTASIGLVDALLDVIAERDVRLVLHLGDQIYADHPHVPALNAWTIASEQRDADKLALYHAIYRGSFALPSYRKLHARVANAMIWDDGEIRDVWGALPLQGVEAELAPAMFEAARAAYVNYQHSHNPPTADGEFHYSFEAGPASFFVLDLRSQRDAAERTLLGARQWAALEAWVRATDGRPLRFLASSVPLLHTPDALVEKVTQLGSPIVGRLPDALYDRWSADAFHAELERLLALLLPRNIVVLSGDIHIGAASEIRDRNDPSHAIHQWISSALTHESGLVHRLESQIVSRATNLATPWPVVKRFHELRNNFGIVELVRREGRWTATFELYVHTGGTAAKPLYRVELTP